MGTEPSDSIFVFSRHSVRQGYIISLQHHPKRKAVYVVALEQALQFNHKIHIIK